MQALDFCFPCQLVWFDEHESTQLAPGGVLAAFKVLDAHRAPVRNSVPELLDFPRCGSRLALAHDLQRTTHFSYYRCTCGHGRLTPFVQFLREKNFVRPLSGNELAALKARVRTVQCSNCGAPVDLEHDTACPYCRSPLAILDPDAVANTLRELNSAEIQRTTIDVDHLADALTMRSPVTANGDIRFGRQASGDHPWAGDLVATGIAIVAALLQQHATRTIIRSRGAAHIGAPSLVAPASIKYAVRRLLMRSMMILRPIFATSIAMLVLGATSALAQSPPPAGGARAVPPHTCVKPEFPGKLGSTARINAFNKDLKVYGDCIKSYIDEVKAIAIAATAAGNRAIDEYNAYTAEIKAKIDAN